MLVGLMLTRPNGNVTNWKVKLKDKRHRIHFSSSFYCFWWNKQFWVKKSKSRKTKPCLATSPFKNETFFQPLLTSQLPNTNTVTWLVISTRNMARTRKRRRKRKGDGDQVVPPTGSSDCQRVCSCFTKPRTKHNEKAEARAPHGGQAGPWMRSHPGSGRSNHRKLWRHCWADGFDGGETQPQLLLLSLPLGAD